MANTLKFGNGVWYGNEGTILAYNDENNNFKPLPFEFDRASIATRVNSSGLIETVGFDQPRVDYKDNPNGQLLLEPTRTNLITYSEDSSNGLWVKRGFFHAGSNFSGPLGHSKATKLIENNTDDNPAYIFNQDLTDGTPRTLSLWLKSDRNITININTNGSSGQIAVDLTTEWQYFSVTNSVNSTSGLHVGGGNTIPRGSGVEIYVAMPQLEEGSYPTSYIPTNGTVVTRAVELCNDSGNSSVFNDNEGVLFIEMSSLVNDNDGSKSISISSGAYSNNIIIQYSTNINQITFKTSPSYTTPIFQSYNVSDITENSKFAFKYKLNDCSFWYNGVKLGSVSSFTPFPSGTLRELNFNRGDSAEVFEGNINKVLYFSTALTDTELEALTTL